MRLHALVALAVSLLVAADDPKPVDILKQNAESDFILRDRNGDGFLDQDEMPDQLKAELRKWDANRDNLISLNEYEFYYATRSQNRRRGDNHPFKSITIIQEDEDLIQEEEDLETRPVVYRAGKLPTRELPSWFMALDTDKDGQVALYEWHRAGKDVDEFRAWDRNDDGYITAEEALYKQHLIQIAIVNSKSEEGDSAALQKIRANTAGDERGGKGKNGGGFDKIKGSQQ